MVDDDKPSEPKAAVRDSCCLHALQLFVSCFDSNRARCAIRLATGTPMNKLNLFSAFIVCLLLASAAILLAGAPAGRLAGDELWPTRGWATASPGSVGLDEQVLLRLDKVMASG